MAMAGYNNFFFSAHFVSCCTPVVVSSTFPLRYIRRMMVNIFYGWTNYLHNFIMPSPQSAILAAEAKAFNDDDKVKINNLIKEIMFINRV